MPPAALTATPMWVRQRIASYKQDILDNIEKKDYVETSHGVFVTAVRSTRPAVHLFTLDGAGAITILDTHNMTFSLLRDTGLDDFPLMHPVLWDYEPASRIVRISYVTEAERRERERERDRERETKREKERETGRSLS
jgi:hypothetical protein